MPTYKPHAYQLAAAEHILGNPGAALFLEPGLGKTSVTLLGLKTLLDAGLVKRVLIIAPLRVAYSVWPAEVAKWDAFSSLKVAVLHGGVKKREAALASDAQICTINPEGLPWLVKLGALKSFDAVVVDESTKFKNRDTDRFRMLRDMLPQMKWRWILTGTPAPNNLQDLWSQMFICDFGKRLGAYVTHFRREYFDEVFNGFAREYHPRPDTSERIEAKIRDIALYMKAIEHLKMPELIFNSITVDLPPSARRSYNQMEGAAFAIVDDKRVTVAQASAAIMKLRQLTGGTVYNEAGEVLVSHTAKLDALSDLVEEQSGQPLLVAVAFKHEAMAIQGMLSGEFGYAAPYLGDGISPKRSDEIAAAWNAGKLPVLLAHPASVSHGLNLQAGGKAVCWFTPTWSLEEYLQFNGRVWRQGQGSTVVVHHIVARDTVDETVIARVNAKDKTQRGLLEILKARKQERTS
jgi:SNF2 family DNA or RNA helicase